MLHDAATERLRLLEERLQLTSEQLTTLEGDLRALVVLVAHEINNPLAGIGGALKLIAERLPEEGQERLVLLTCRKRLLALRTIVDNLLLFARPTELVLAHQSLCSLLREAAKVLGQDGELGEIALEIAGDDVEVLADPHQLIIAWQNLYLNLGQTMSGGGTLRVVVKRLADRCQLEIADADAGTLTARSTRSFEPYFTADIQGAGLGLTIARRIIQAHGGDLQVKLLQAGYPMLWVSLPLPERA